jgi:hypothetical protein
MDVQSLLDEVGQLEVEVTDLAAGDARLSQVIARIHELQRELEQMRGMSQPLIADAERPPSSEERSEANLGSALESLLRAAEAKRAAPTDAAEYA